MPAMVLITRRALFVWLAVLCVQAFDGGFERLPGYLIRPRRDRCPLAGCGGHFQGQLRNARVLFCSNMHRFVRNDEGKYVRSDRS